MNNIKNYFLFTVRSFAVVIFLSLPAVNAQVVINELMYNPIHSGGGTNDDGEFIELLNIGVEPINLSGWSFRPDGFEFVFPEGADINPGEHLLIGRDSVEFFTQHGFYFEYEWTAGNLSNSGEDSV